VAPPAGPALGGRISYIIFGIIILAAIAWLILANLPPPAPKEVKVIKVNATPPAAAAVTAVTPPVTPAAPAAGVAGLFACPYEAYRTRHGVIVCGVVMVADQYVMIQKGWIWAPNATALRIVGDLSTCAVRLGVNTMYLDCSQPVMILR